MWLLFATITVLLWGTSEINLNILITYLPVALIYIASMFCTYKAMTLVKVSILSPLQNSSWAITTILCIFLLKQEVGIPQIIARALIIICMILLSINKDETLRLESGDKEADAKNAKRAYLLYLKGIAFALGYWFLDGIGSFMDDYTLEANLSAEQVIIAYSFIYGIIGVICAIVVNIKDRDYKYTKVKENKLKLLRTLVENAGQYTYIYAFAFGDVALASLYIAAYSVVTVILSRIFLKEKLSKKQYVLIALILDGMITLSIE